jgi:uncharacterized repeat protein (TIGR01451 family)
VTWPQSPQTILAAGNSAQYRTTDGGNLWSAITAGLPVNAKFGKLVTAASDRNIAYASAYDFPVNAPATRYGLYRSADGGRTWGPAGSDGPRWIFALAVDPLDAQTLYVATDTQFLKSTDGGKTYSLLNWDSTLQGDPFILAIDPVHSSILYAATVSRISRSVDAGASWQTLPSSPAAPTGSWWVPNDLIVDPNRSNDVLVATGKNGVFRMTVAPDLSLKAQIPGTPPLSGSPFASTYTATNNGPFDATGVQLVVNLPANAQNSAGSLSGGNCTIAASVVTCTLPVLRTGASVTASVSAVAPTSGAFQITGSLSGEQPDPDTTNNSVVTNAQVSAAADLSIAASGPSTAQAGDAVSYTLTVSNAGPDTATGTRLNYQVAAGINVAAVTTTSGACTSSGSGAVSCSLGDVPAKGAVTVTINATAAAAGTVNATMSVSSNQPDPDMANSSTTSSTTVSVKAQSGAGGGGGNGSGGGGALTAGWLLALAALLLTQKWLQGARYLCRSSTQRTSSGTSAGSMSRFTTSPC